MGVCSVWPHTLSHLLCLPVFLTLCPSGVPVATPGAGVGGGPGETAGGAPTGTGVPFAGKPGKLVISPIFFIMNTVLTCTFVINLSFLQIQFQVQNLLCLSQVHYLLFTVLL